jgi:outer membrane protein assembly factor BamB
LLVTLPAANASDPPIEIPTFAYLAITPNPTGINQQVFFVMWLHAAPPTAAGIAGDRWRDFTVTVTRPDGETETLGPYLSDATGSTYGLYTPTQIGTYKFVFEYPGQVLSLNHPENGLPGSNSPYINDTFLASSATEYLTVQEEQVTSSPEYPLPASYWVRPIEAQNQMWSQVASNWLGSNYFGTFQQTGLNLWQRNGAGPESSHILWTRPIEFGGLVGGSFAVPNAGFYSGGSYEGRFTNAIIMSGRLYYQEPLGHSNTGGGYTCVDLRTGEVIWHNDKMGTIGGSAAPTFGQLYDYESMNQHGVVGGMLWATSGTTWMAYDAFTGKSVYNLTGVPAGGFTAYTDNGEIVKYILNYNTATKKGSIALWNNTAEQQGLHGAIGTSSNAYQWRPNGKTVNMSQAFSWNVTINDDITGTANPSIISVIPGDVIIGTSTRFMMLGGIIAETPETMTFWAISDKPENRGELLWIKNQPTEGEFLTPYLGPVDPVSRVFAITYIETMDWVGYSVDTGEQLWGPVTGVENDFGYYGSGRGGGQIGFTAYGNLYTQGFGGELICYSMTTGDVLWKYNNTNSGMETAWGNYPIFIAAIADGKVYAFNNEHSPNYPLYKGEKIYCIDAMSGEELWTMAGWAGQSGGTGASTGILADSTLVYYNYYDNQLYAVGKGPSSITIAVNPGITSQGKSVQITGTVTDTSAGAKSLVEKGVFNIVPAVSDQSQSAWMEYIYMQKPMPSNVVGVSVNIFATDANGHTEQITTVVSDSSGLFHYKWTPPQEGEYTITAVFDGSNSYYGSSATTAVGVDQASANPIETESPSAVVDNPSSTSTETLLIAAAAAVIVIAVIVAALVLRKRK